MAQTAARNPEGMATSFRSTQTVNIRATTEAQLVQVLRSLSAAGFESRPLALVQTGLSNGHRQINTLKALMVGPACWDALIAGSGMDVVRSISVALMTSDFLLAGDRFARMLSTLAPRQELVSKTFGIVLSGGVGLVDLGVPFDPASLKVSGPVPTASFPSTGLLQFDAGDVGLGADVSFVTAPVFKAVKILRTHDQVPDSNGVVHPPYAYVMHPMLAPLLGLAVPPV